MYKFTTFGLDVVNSLAGPQVKTSLQDAGFDILSRFSQVTKVATDRTTAALEHPLARPLLPYIPEHIRGHFLSSQETAVLLAEYDSAGQYLMRYAHELLAPVSKDLKERWLKEELVVTLE